MLVLDEIQMRHGPHRASLFAHEWTGVAPDIMAVAKGLGGGFPIGACLATEPRPANAMTAGSHGSTFGGNPLAMAVANAVLDVVLAKTDSSNSVRRAWGCALKQKLAMAFADEHDDVIAEVRGRGPDARPEVPGPPNHRPGGGTCSKKGIC